MTEPALLVFDVESSGVDVFNDRVVQLVIGLTDSRGDLIEVKEWVINPGIEVPQGAIDVHGFSNEYLAEHGQPPQEAFTEIFEYFRKYHALTWVAFNANYDVSILDAEFERHWVSPDWGDRVARGIKLYDPIVVDRAKDKYRRGGRKLMNLADHFGIGYNEDELHNAVADVTLTAKVAVATLSAYGTATNAEQAQWYRSWAEGLQKYFNRQGKDETVNTEWPLRKDRT